MLLAREAARLGPRASIAMGLRHLQRGIERFRGLDVRRHVAAQLPADTLRLEIDPQSVVAFRDGAASLGWAATRSPALVRDHLRQHHPDHVDHVLASARACLEGTVLLFGHSIRLRDADGNIGWQRDWLGVHVWDPCTPSARIAIGSEPGADPRVAWEVGRCHHVVTLAQAFLLSGDPTFAEHAIAHIGGFIADNPVGYGIQWASTMDAAIRVANWLVAWDLLGDSTATRGLSATLLRSVIEHGRFIANNLENRDGVTSNHYLADLAGLAYLSRLAAVWPPFAPWYDHWKSEAAREVRRQVLPDGFSFEGSVCYHRLALELLVYPAALERGGAERSSSLSLVIRRMCDAIDGYASTMGVVPQFGDNDSGRLHSLHMRDDLDQRYLLGLGGAICGIDYVPETPEEVWVTGPRTSPAVPRALPPVAVLPDAGIVTIRRGRAQLSTICGKNGQAGRGGHSHNDKLSFVLFVDGAGTIVDPGTYEYTRDVQVRQLFRSTAFHSTLALDDAEQSRFSLISAFRLIPDAEPLPYRVRVAPSGFTVIAGGHTGYKRRPTGLRHERRFMSAADGSCWCVLDRIVSTTRRRRAEPVRFVWTLPLAPETRIGRVEDDEWELVSPTGAGLRGTTRIRHGTGVWSVESGWISPGYGRRVPTTFLRLRGTLAPNGAWRAIRTEIFVGA